jgi:hypothetical protein
MPTVVHINSSSKSRLTESPPYLKAIFAPVPISNSADTTKVEITFQGHYEEPNLELSIPMSMIHSRPNTEVWINMKYSPYTRKWESVLCHSSETKEELAKIEYKHAGLRNAIQAAPAAARSVSKPPGTGPRKSLLAPRSPTRAPVQKQQIIKPKQPVNKIRASSQNRTSNGIAGARPAAIIKVKG